MRAGGNPLDAWKEEFLKEQRLELEPIPQLYLGLFSDSGHPGDVLESRLKGFEASLQDLKMKAQNLPSKSGFVSLTPGVSLGASFPTASSKSSGLWSGAMSGGSSTSTVGSASVTGDPEKQVKSMELEFKLIREKLDKSRSSR